MKYWQKQGYPVSGGVLRSLYGIVKGHAFSVLDVVELKKNGRVTYKLVKLRNPWGSEKYYGPFSDKSSKWDEDPSYRRQAGGVKEANDGVFFLPYNIWAMTMQQVSVAFTKDWKYGAKIHKKGRGRKVYYKLHNPVAQQVMINFYSKMNRNYPARCQQYAAPRMLVMILHKKWGRWRPYNYSLA